MIPLKKCFQLVVGIARILVKWNVVKHVEVDVQEIVF